MPLELGSFSLGAVAGGVVVGIFNHFLTKSRNAEDRRIKTFNDIADLLRNALIKSKQRLENAGGSRSVIKNDFLDHDELRRRFEMHLSGEDITRFTEAWNNYQNWYEKIACAERSTLDYPYMHPQKDDADFQRALAQKPEELINQIIPYTKHK